MLRRVLFLLDPAAAPASGAPPVQPAAAAPVQPEPNAEPPVAEPPQPGEPPVEPPVEEPQPEPADVNDDPLMAALLRDMGPEPEPEIKPVPDAAPAVVEPAAATPAAGVTPPAQPAPVAEPKKKKRVSIVDKIGLEPVVPSPAPAAAVVPPVPPAPPAPPTVDPEAAYVASLTDEQREELAEAEYAERMFPERYKNRRKNLIDWYRQLDATAQRLATSDPEKPLDENNEEWTRFMRTKPKLDGAHGKQILRTMAKEEAQREVQSAIEPKLNELERKQKEAAFEPKLDKVMDNLESAMDEFIAEDEASPISQAMREIQKDPAKAAEFKLEKKIVDEEKAWSGQLTREFMKFTRTDARGRPDPVALYDSNNRTHRELIDFINRQGELMTQQPAAVTVRGGKAFLPRSQYMEAVRKDPSVAQRHWTFANKDIIDMLALQARVNMENRFKQVMADNAALGFERAKKPNSAAVPNGGPAAGAKKEPVPTKKPVVAPKPARGPASAPTSAPADTGINVVATLFPR